MTHRRLTGRRTSTVRRLPLLVGAVAIVLLLAACGTGGESAPEAGARAVSPAAGSGAAAVTIQRFRFMPQRIEVAPGTTLTFTNQDEVLHTVTAGTPEDFRPQAFDGQLDGVGAGEATFELTLKEPGTYRFVCTRHPEVPGMTGTIVVQGEA